MAPSISLKALVDKASQKVIFIESGNEFVDVLFSFLTIPMATIIKRAGDISVPLGMGCMKNLYASVKDIDEKDFRSSLCKEMLLCPCNDAASHCKNLKLIYDNTPKPDYFLCSKRNCLSYNFYSTHGHCHTCPCGSSTYDRKMDLSVNASKVGGVFVKECTRLIVSDDLQVQPLSAASDSLFVKFGIKDGNSTEEMVFDVGVEEVLNLLVSSLVSKRPLTAALLKRVPDSYLCKVNVNQIKSFELNMFGDPSNEVEEKIPVKLMVSKSRKIVCYAEARADFVNLLFSFLTLPLGFVVKDMQEGSFEGCIDQLWKSVKDLDQQYLRSNYHKEMLLSPKIVPGFCYKNSLLGTEEASYYYVRDSFSVSMITTDRSLISSDSSSEPVKLDVKDPKSYDDKDESAKGFLKEPAVFTVTDNLIVRPISPIFELSVLKDLNVPVTDIEDHIVHVGKKEALCLLVASFVCDNSALTNAFISTLKLNKTPKQEH